MLYVVYIKQKHGRAKKINEYNDGDEDNSNNNNNDDDHDNNADRKREAHRELSGIEYRTQSFFSTLYVL